ncbi:von Willebrand factor, type A [Seminavis robusta]|uniref:von Willebrand factor, type A n=1 Tax=Seminavis robusta TaxID=568900 RepID=A0A9N8HI26_9STRA|nr:von Willebrand factor, type A [Seminavis robusta]|eukprot:Sro751_g197050.1 von Willebrand factor, type A (404) ;mRNA; f:14456-15667
MGLFKSMFKKAKKSGEAMLGIESKATPPPMDPENPPTRWEKAVVGLNGIVAQVSKIDPDGVDVVCFGGDGAPDMYRNVKDIGGLESMVTAKEPAGACHMGAAMDIVLKEAFARGFDERPCSILVLTAGRPDDSAALDAAIQDATGKIAAMEDKKESPLTITFVQVGDDEQAEEYLKHLDDNLTSASSSSGETIDIVDTIKDEEIKKAMGEFKEEGFLSGGKGGALFGAFAGAAMGVGGMYLYNKLNANKRTEGWNGKWKATYEGEEVAVLTVKDDGEGNLAIEGFPVEEGEEGGSTTGNYAENDEGGYNIQFTAPEENEPIYGTVEDEHTIAWSDGTRWEEVPPDGGHWAGYAGAAAAGAATAGATGYLLQKKFFNKASKQVPSDYVIVLDRSAKMAIPDTGK